MSAKAKITGFTMMMVLVLSVPCVYADTGNGGNLGTGQTTPSTVVSNPSTSDSSEHEWKHGHWGRHNHHMEHKLNLTDDQKKAMKDLWQKQRESMKATFEQIKANREAYNKEIAQEAPDMNKINDLQAQFKTIQAQMVDNRLASTLEVKKILNPEQFGKYLELKKHEFAERFHKERREHKSHWCKHEGNAEGGCHKDHHEEWDTDRGE